MDNNQTQQPAVPVPEIPKEELKLPTENVAAPAAAAPAPKKFISPLLVILLVFSLAVLGAVIFFGDKILDIIMPMDPAPSETITEVPIQEEPAPTPKTTEEEIAEIEAAASSTDKELAETEAELDAIDAELEADLE